MWLPRIQSTNARTASIYKNIFFVIKINDELYQITPIEIRATKLCVQIKIDKIKNRKRNCTIALDKLIDLKNSHTLPLSPALFLATRLRFGGTIKVLEYVSCHHYNSIP